MNLSKNKPLYVSGGRDILASSISVRADHVLRLPDLLSVDCGITVEGDGSAVCLPGDALQRPDSIVQPELRDLVSAYGAVLLKLAAAADMNDLPKVMAGYKGTLKTRVHVDYLGHHWDHVSAGEDPEVYRVHFTVVSNASNEDLAADLADFCVSVRCSTEVTSKNKQGLLLQSLWIPRGKFFETPTGDLFMFDHRKGGYLYRKQHGTDTFRRLAKDYEVTALLQLPANPVSSTGALQDVTFRHVASFPTKTPTDGSLCPESIALAPDGSIVVSATQNDTGRVLVFDPKGNLISTIGSRRKGDCYVEYPWGVAIGRQGYVLVADYEKGVGKAFSMAGELMFKFGHEGEGKLYAPAGITVLPSGEICVADRDRHRIAVYDSSGAYVRRFGTHGSGSGQFKRPVAMVTNSQGHLVIADSYNHRIQVLTASGVFLFSYGSVGDALGQFRYPYGLALWRHDHEEYVIVTDCSNNRVQVFDSNGSAVSSFGSPGKDDGRFSAPTGVAVNAQGDFVIADCNNARISIFHPEATRAPAASATAGATPMPSLPVSSSGVAASK